MLDIDVSSFKDMGQALRTASILAIQTGTPYRIYNIPEPWKRSGLTSQQILEINSLSRLCDGKIEINDGALEEILFFPGNILKNSTLIKAGPDNDITAILQALTLPSLSIYYTHPNQISSTRIIIEGGSTDAFFSPGIDYFNYVFLGIVKRINGKVGLIVQKRGYQSEGGANIELKIYPQKTKVSNLTDRGKLKKFLVISGASEVFRSKKIAELQIAGARDILGKMKLPIEEKAEYYDTLCPGNQICIAADFENTIIGTYRIGKFKETAKDIGKEAALDLIKKGRSDACFDEYSAPYFLLYSSLLPSGSQITVPEVNSTLKEIMLIAEKFLKGKFEIDDNLITWKPKP